jgi:hypothetical protein
MDFLQSQGRLNALVHSRTGYFRKVSFQKYSPWIFIVILLIHFFLVIIILNAKIRRGESFTAEPVMQIVRIAPDYKISIPEPTQPIVDIKSHNLYLDSPELDFSEIYESPLDLSIPQSDLPYQLPDQAAQQYKNVFDPKLRKKLLEAQPFNASRKIAKPNSWTEADGRTFVDIGNGMCLVSMPKTDSHERGTNWGHTRCGKTNSEKMMDNVNADLEARKHPSLNAN